jgi:penicillin-binding protein 1B
VKKLKRIFLILGSLSCLVILALGLWLFQLNTRIREGLEQRKFLPPTEYYAAPLQFSKDQRWTLEDVKKILLDREYRERQWDQKLFPGDYTIGQSDQCRASAPEQVSGEISECLLLAPKENNDPDLKDVPLEMLSFSLEGILINTFQGNPLQLSAAAFLEPRIFAQYLDNQPIRQNYKALGEIPTQCLNAVLAIEDSKFLEHSGFSFSGFARAFVSNISGRARQGGSTITQQLVKNYFLTAERTYKRKLIELAMAVLLESHASKDQILETYLNVIYLGQNGPFQVRGFGAAAQYYFAKSLEQLALPDCALLAAVLNGPGVFDPFRKPENAIKRRNLVLDRMLELKMISSSDNEQAKISPLPKDHSIAVNETAPYYIDAVNKEIAKMNFELVGLKVFTGLSITDQQAAQESVRSHLNNLESNNKKIKSLKESGLTLEGLLISADNQSGLLTAIVGGRSYRLTQFNRALDAHRQVGSIMKPFVFLSALLSSGEKGKTYDPLTVLNDSRFSFKYEGQTWSPENYGKKYFGPVPMYFALKNSLNSATASLGLEIGLGKIIETARALGLQSDLQEVPSLTLGAFELYPAEVLSAYVSLARFGNSITLSPIRYVTDDKDQILYAYHPVSEQKLPSIEVASLVSMMRQTTQSGTAQWIGKSGFPIPAAGKTGTTSDNKDAWFAGFTPNKTAVAWVGYDSPTANGLTGASGAVPIWLNFMKTSVAHDSTSEFIWPEDAEVRHFDLVEASAQSESKEVSQKEPLQFNLVFRK